MIKNNPVASTCMLTVKSVATWPGFPVLLCGYSDIIIIDNLHELFEKTSDLEFQN